MVLIELADGIYMITAKVIGTQTLNTHGKENPKVNLNIKFNNRLALQHLPISMNFINDSFDKNSQENPIHQI